MCNPINIKTDMIYNIILYGRYNLRGLIFRNHQISHLAVIFAIIKPNQMSCLSLIDILFISEGLYMKSGVDLFYCQATGLL